ncbi:class E sortase [Jatrophihabitans sp. YIM 134969]
MTATQVALGGDDGDGGGRHSATDTLPRRRSRADKVRLVARGIGQTLITGGLIILLFVVYEVWVTNLFAAQKQSEVHKAFQQVLDQPTVGSETLQLPGAAQKTIPAGQGIANLYIPTFGQDFNFTVVEGVNDADLEKGPGHYSGTALPGQEGNFSVAGHRVGKGEPFLNLDQLKPGDAVVVQVPGFWYVYQILGQGTDLSKPDANGVVGREIVAPTDVAVIAPTPDKADSQPSGSYMTMTTCHPKYSASQRMILHAKLTATKPAKGKLIPTELGGTL